MSPVPTAGTSTKLNEGTYSIWGGKGAIVTAASKMAVQINTGKTVPVAIVSATSITGSNATAVPVEGETISLVNYVLVDTPTTGKMSIVLNISCDASSKALSEAGFDGASYWIIVTDEDGTILKIKDLGDIASVSYATADVDVGTATVGDKIAIGFLRSVGSGGLKIHAITLTATSKSAAESTPAASNFTATACTTSDQNDGKITITGIEDVTTLEYKLSTADDYTDVTAAEITGLVPGTYVFRYKETDDYLASGTVSVEVAKWVDETINFTSFVSGVDIVETANTSKQSYSDDNVAWSVTSADYQVLDGDGNTISYNTYDYNATTGAGYSYTAGRLKVKTNAVFTIGKLTEGQILRIDGENASTDARTFTITGADKTSWVLAKKTSNTAAAGSFYLTASGDTVTLTASADLCIYGIHTVSSVVEVTKQVEAYDTVYTAPVIAVEPTSVANDVASSITVSVTTAATKTVYDLYSDATSVAQGEATKPTLTYTVTAKTEANTTELSVVDSTIAIAAGTTADTYTVTAAVLEDGETQTSGTVKFTVTDPASTAKQTATITYFDSSSSTYSAAGAVDGDSIVTVGDASFAWSANVYGTTCPGNVTEYSTFANGSPSIKEWSNAAFNDTNHAIKDENGDLKTTTDSNGKTAYYLKGAYFNPAGKTETDLTGTKYLPAAILSFTITAGSKAVVINSISAIMAQTQTDNLMSYIQIGDTKYDGTAGKDECFDNVEIGVTVAAGATVTVNIISGGSKKSTSSL